MAGVQELLQIPEVLATGFVLYKAVWEPWRRRVFYQKQGVGGPQFVPLLGNLLELQKARSAPRAPVSVETNGLVEAMHPYILNWSSRDPPGKRMVVWEMLDKTHLGVWDAELWRDFTVTHATSYKRNEVLRDAFATITGLGIVALDTDSFWAQQRKIISQGFRTQFLKGLHHHMERATAGLVEIWDKRIAEQGGCAEITPIHDINRTTLEVVTYSTFGAAVAGSQDSESLGLIYRALEEQLLSAVEGLFTIKNLLPGNKFLPKTKMEGHAAEAGARLEALVQDLVERRIEAVQPQYEAGDSSTNNSGHDLLGIMVDAHLRGSKTMSRHQIIQECRTMFVAGFGSTAQLINWTLMLLANHPEWQSKAREEVRRVSGGTGILNPADLAKLTTMGNILNESLRLYPPVTDLIREAKSKHRIGDLEVHSGTIVHFYHVLMHIDPEYWGDNPLQFNPDRFQNGIEAAQRKNANAFHPFGDGPRICVGQAFALMEAKSVLAALLLHFKWNLSPNYKHAPTNIVMTTSNAVLLHVERV